VTRESEKALLSLFKALDLNALPHFFWPILVSLLLVYHLWSSKYLSIPNRAWFLNWGHERFTEGAHKAAPYC